MKWAWIEHPLEYEDPDWEWGVDGRAWEWVCRPDWMWVQRPVIFPGEWVLRPKEDGDPSSEEEGKGKGEKGKKRQG